MNRITSLTPKAKQMTRHFGTSHVRPNTTVNMERVYCVDANAGIGETSAILAQRNVGSVLVVDMEDATVKGLVTERDITKQVGKGVSNDHPISDFMTPAAKLFTATKNSSIEEIMLLMQKNNIRHIPVMEPQNNQIVEMHSIKNVMNRVLEIIENDNSELRKYL